MESLPVPAAPASSPVETAVVPDNTIHKSLLNPELRLSRRQREVLGMVGVKVPATEKQAARNKVAGDRLKAFHVAKRKTKQDEEDAKRKAFEAEANVKVVGQAKRERVRLKQKTVPVYSDDESSDPEMRRRAKKASKTAKALEKLDDTISRVASVAAPSNPYLTAMMMRHF